MPLLPEFILQFTIYYYMVIRSLLFQVSHLYVHYLVEVKWFTQGVSFLEILDLVPESPCKAKEIPPRVSVSNGERHFFTKYDKIGRINRVFHYIVALYKLFTNCSVLSGKMWFLNVLGILQLGKSIMILLWRINWMLLLHDSYYYFNLQREVFDNKS